MTPTDDRALAVIALEANGHHPEKPFAGLTLHEFRAARARLVKDGLVVLSLGGRYVPAGKAQDA